MQIDSVTLYAGRMPVKVLFSYGTLTAFDFLIVRLRAGAYEGLGEAMVPVPAGFPGYLSRLIDADAGLLDRLLPETFSEPLERIAYESVSMALHDLVARASRQSLAALLGAESVRELSLMPCIFPASPKEAGEQARAWRQRGFRYLKTKLSGAFDEDFGRIQAIRESAPDLVMLQADANGGYTGLTDAVRAVGVFGDAGLDLFEDPMAGGAEEYAELRRRCRGGRAKIMVDELARETGILEQALRCGAADAVNIHPDQPGSLTLVRKHIGMAGEFGIPVFIGGTGYTGIGSAVYWQLSAALLPGQPCGELGGFLDHGMPVGSALTGNAVKDGVMYFDSALHGSGAIFDYEAMKPFIASHATWRG